MDTAKHAKPCADTLPDYIWQQLIDYCQAQRLRPQQVNWVVGFSGGKDSTALAHAMSQLKAQKKLQNITLMHVHHGLQEFADRWLIQCEERARELVLNFAYSRVNVKEVARKSTEALAREARYEALYHYCLQHSATLLLAHHIDDVLETVLLQLKRGAGPKGLAGMAAHSTTKGVQQLRPLLSVPQSVLLEYMSKNSLSFIDDPSNSDERFERNFIRHRVSPILLDRWPQIKQAVARSAALCAQQDELISEYADKWISENQTTERTLPLANLLQQSQGWQREIFRRWCQNKCAALPSQAQLESFMKTFSSAQDKQPELRYGKVTVRLYNKQLYIAVNEPPVQDLRSIQPIEIYPRRVELRKERLVLSIHDAEPEPEQALFEYRVTVSDSLTLSFVSDEMRLALTQNSAPRRYQRLCKDLHIPPWQRKHARLLCVNSTPVALLFDYRCIALSAAGLSRENLEHPSYLLFVTAQA